MVEISVQEIEGFSRRMKSGNREDADSARDAAELMKAISDTMVVLETSFALLDTLHSGRILLLARRMLKYSFPSLDGFANECAQGGFKREAIAETFHFPSVEQLGLGRGEERAYEKAVRASCDYLGQSLAIAARFYFNHKIPYNKFKHGLSFSPTRIGGDEGIEATVVLDRREDLSRIRAEHVPLDRRPLPPGIDWFNIFALIPLRPNVLDFYLSILGKAAEIIDCATRNLENWVANCGQDYWPVFIFETEDTATELLGPLEKAASRVQRNMLHIRHHVVLNFPLEPTSQAYVKDALAVDRIATFSSRPDTEIHPAAAVNVDVND